MPKNTDPITNQEIDFARHLLSGTMTDRCAAGAAGLDPDSAAETKAKPCVRAYLLAHQVEHQAADPQHPIEQDPGEPRPITPDRGQILARLWEIANLSPESTRGSISGQVKALSLIVAIEGLIPDRRALTHSKSGPPPVKADIYAAAWRRTQPDENPDPQPAAPAPTPETAPDPSPAAPTGPIIPASLMPAQTMPAMSRLPHGRLRCSRHQNRLLHKPLYPTPLSSPKKPVYVSKRPKPTNFIEFYKIRAAAISVLYQGPT